MDDIRKLENIIDALEGQAKQVTEYSGLLSAVNHARTEIEGCAATFQSSAHEAKNLVSENRDHLTRLNEALTSIGSNHKSFADESRGYLDQLNAHLETLKNEHNNFAAEIRVHLEHLNSRVVSLAGDSKTFYIESKGAVERLENALLVLDKSIKGIEQSNKQISSSIASLDIVTPLMLKDGLAASRKHSLDNFEEIKAIINDLSKKQEKAYKTTSVLLVALIVFNAALAIYLFSK